VLQTRTNKGAVVGPGKANFAGKHDYRKNHNSYSWRVFETHTPFDLPAQTILF